ncbi:hypothetical protein [Parasphingorhabdus sp.]
MQGPPIRLTMGENMKEGDDVRASHARAGLAVYWNDGGFFYWPDLLLDR